MSDPGGRAGRRSGRRATPREEPGGGEGRARGSLWTQFRSSRMHGFCLWTLLRAVGLRAPAAAPRTRQVISCPGPGFVPFPGPGPAGREPLPGTWSAPASLAGLSRPALHSAGEVGREETSSVLAACPSEGQRASQVRQQTWEGWPGTAGLGHGVSPRLPWAVPGQYAG